jgi:hypothetical protein
VEEIMFPVRPKLRTILSLAVAAGLTLPVPREAHATVGGGLGGPGFSLFLYMVCAPLGGTNFSCSQAGVRVDPVGDVRHLSMTLDYDLFGANFVFNAALTGPLDVFSVGGSAPPATPGVGTQPVVPGINLFPVFPDTPGAPLPGSVLSVVDNGLVVTMDYLLAAPVNVMAETNFFVFGFDFNAPLPINTANTVVRYSTGILPGADFVVFDPVCEGSPDAPLCGSTTPAMSIRIDTIPEPSTWVLVGSGLALAAALLRRRRVA